MFLVTLGLVIVAATYLAHTTIPIPAKVRNFVKDAYTIGWLLVLFGGIGELFLA